MPRMPAITAYPSDRTIEKVRRMAERENRSMSWVATQLIEKGIRDYEAEADKRKTEKRK